MKWILTLLFITFSSACFAYKITDYSGECLTLGEKKTYSCTIQKGVSGGGKFVYLQFNQNEYLVEQSTSCGGNCKPYLGTTPETVKVAKNFKKDRYDCYQQEQGKLGVCYMISK